MVCSAASAVLHPCAPCYHNNTSECPIVSDVLFFFLTARFAYPLPCALPCLCGACGCVFCALCPLACVCCGLPCAWPMPGPVLCTLPPTPPVYGGLHPCPIPLCAPCFFGALFPCKIFGLILGLIPGVGGKKIGLAKQGLLPGVLIKIPEKSA